MRRAVTIGIAALALAGANDAGLKIGPAPGSALNLYVDKTGLLSGKRHHFTFERFTGQVSADLSKVEFNVEAASIVCRDIWVSEKDRAKILKVALEDMLTASKHPEIRFESTQIKSAGGDNYTVDGVLTIRETSKSITLTVRRAAAAQYTGEARIRLTHFGLKPPSAALGLIGTKDEMLLTFTLSTELAEPKP